MAVEAILTCPSQLDGCALTAPSPVILTETSARRVVPYPAAIMMMTLSLLVCVQTTLPYTDAIPQTGKPNLRDLPTPSLL